MVSDGILVSHGNCFFFFHDSNIFSGFHVDFFCMVSLVTESVSHF